MTPQELATEIKNVLLNAKRPKLAVRSFSDALDKDFEPFLNYLISEKEYQEEKQKKILEKQKIDRHKELINELKEIEPFVPKEFRVLKG